MTGYPARNLFHHRDAETLRNTPFMSTHSEPIGRNELRNLLLVLAVAAVLRLGWPGIQEFKRDEAALLSLSLDLVEGVAFPLRGIGSSVGIPNSPVSVFLYALPMLAPWNRTPTQAGLFAGELGVLAVFLTWLVTRRYWGGRAALVAAMLFAASPWAAFYARKVWAQNLLPLFTLAWIASGLLVFAEGRRRWLAPHLLALALLAQIHLSGIALVPVTLLAIVLHRKTVGLKWLLLGGALAVASLIPYGAYALGQGAASVRQLGGVAARPAEWSADSAWFAWMITSGAYLHSLAGPQAFRDFLDSVGPLAAAPWAVTVVFLLGIGYWLARPWRERHAADVLAGAWLALPILFFLRHSTPVYPHYFIILFPAPYMLAGAGLAALFERIDRPAWRQWAGAGLVLLAAALALLFVRLLTFVGSVATPGGFGNPVGRLESLAALVRAERGGAEEVVVVSEGDSPELDEIPAVASVLLRGEPLRFVDGDEASVWPGRDSLILLWPGTRAAERDYEGWGEAVGGQALRADEGAVELRRIDGPPGLDAFGSPVPGPRILANGVELIGYGWDGDLSPGTEMLWRLAWRPGWADGDYHFFNHLLSGDGTKTMGVDGEGLASRAWREGDWVVSYFPFPLPAELPDSPFTMRVGMYEYPGLASVPVLDEAANPYSDAVSLGPIVGR